MRLASPLKTFVVALLIFFAIPAVFAQTKDVPPAPIPAPILNARRIFVANAGGEIYPVADLFHGGPDRAYNQFYAAMKDWGRYELLPAPSDADLVFEIAFSLGNSVFVEKPTLDPHIRLTIVDPKTHVPLWVLTEHVPGAMKVAHRDENFDHAMAKLVEDVKALVSKDVPGPAKP